jgi:hypothetical protein
MAAKFKVEAKTFLYFKTSIFNIFWLIVLLQKIFFSKNSEWPKKFIWQIFWQRNRSMKCFCFLIFYTSYSLMLYSNKNCCQSWKMAAIYKMASKMFIFFTQYFQKLYFWPFFFCFFLIFWVKIKLLWKNFFLIIQNGGII